MRELVYVRTYVADVQVRVYELDSQASTISIVTAVEFHSETIELELLFHKRSFNTLSNYLLKKELSFN